MPVDPGIAVLLDLLSGSGYPPMHEGSPETARKALRAMTVDAVPEADRVPVGEVVELDLGGIPARGYRPEGEGPWPTLVYLHGGGFVIGDLDTHDQTCRRLCAGAATYVVSVDYRLAPEHPFPAAVDDALDAVDHVCERLGELGGTDVLAVGGDSAGGNLAAVAAQLRRGTVSAQLLIYPVVDPLGDYPSRTENGEGYFLDRPTMEWFFTHYAVGALEHGTDADDVRLAPLAGNLVGVAPALVVTAGFDPLRDEGEAYADGLAAAGVPVDRLRYDALIHGFLDMGPFSPAAVSAIDEVVARTRTLLHG